MERLLKEANGIGKLLGGSGGVQWIFFSGKQKGLATECVRERNRQFLVRGERSGS
jgi:hypothetical protein